jgi:hypothetical protein
LRLLVDTPSGAAFAPPQARGLKTFDTQLLTIEDWDSGLPFLWKAATGEQLAAARRWEGWRKRRHLYREGEGKRVA